MKCVSKFPLMNTGCATTFACIPAVVFTPSILSSPSARSDRLRAVGRSPAVYELVGHAAVLADRGPAQMQLLAAARVLQAFDGAALGQAQLAQQQGQEQRSPACPSSSAYRSRSPEGT